MEFAATHVVEIEAKHGEVRPVIPADQFCPNLLEIGESDRNLDRPRAGDVGVGENESIAGNDHTGADAASESLRALLERDFTHVDANDSVEQAVEALAHRGVNSRRG